MSINYINIILSILYGITSLYSPIGESYTLILPSHIDVQDQGSFKVRIKDDSISENETLSINFEDSFTLSDKHGKDDIYGTIDNPSLVFDIDNANEKTVNYHINNISSGEWSGNLNLTITYNKKAEGNVLIDGSSINSILSSLNPSTISFSHDNIAGDYLYDISLAQDESILMYQDGSDITITNKINEPIKANEDMSNIFSMLNITAINNLNYLDMSSCVDMSRMFLRCEKLKTLDVSSFVTSNVTNMSHAFDSMHACTNITGLENFDVSNVEDLSYLLNDNRALTSVPNLTGWNISNKCKDLSYMMCCIAYTAGSNGKSKWPTSEVNYTNWDVSGVKNMSHLFMNAFMLTKINLSGWNTSNVVDMSSMFEMTDSNDRSRLQVVTGLDGFDVTNVTNMERMFYNCLSLATADFSTWEPISVNSLNNCFYETRKLNLNVFENWDNYFDVNEVDITDCFGGYAGYMASGSYKPSWYN